MFSLPLEFPLYIFFLFSFFCSWFELWHRFKVYNIINLTHLEVDFFLVYSLYDSLEFIPRGIGQLASLKTLSCFVVAKTSPISKMVCELKELSGLNEFRVILDITTKGYERNFLVWKDGGKKSNDEPTKE